MTKKSKTLIIHNIGQLVTFEPLAKANRLHNIKESDLGIKINSFLQIEKGKLVNSGEGKPPSVKGAKKIDAKGALVLPGLVDSHTHPVFGGTRCEEYAMKLSGKTYQEIADRGGGIESTVKATRATSEKELIERVYGQFKRWLTLGVTTFEVKSGYGLSVKEELRQLKVINKLKKKTPQHVESTCLALHAIPNDQSKNDYIKDVCDNLLPLIKKEKLANWVDAFIEKGYFSPSDCQPYFDKAKELGLGIRIHADEFSDAGGAAAAAMNKAASADHLQFASPLGIKAMSQNNVVATLLPGTSLYSKIPFTQAKPFRDAGCAIAIATDFNPGSCMIDNLPFLTTIAAMQCGLNPAEAIAAVTIVPAASLNLAGRKGALVEGYDADFCVFKNSSVEQWLANAGQSLPDQVWIDGIQEI